jgi:hypothetical protein
VNELERLKSALNEAPPEPFAAPDLARIMADGTRIRRRRRLLTGAGAAAAVVAVVAVVFGAVQLRPQPQQAPVAAAPSTVGPASTVPSTAAPATERATPLGDVVSLGIKNPAGELVLYAYKMDEPQALPGVSFGLMLAVRDSSGLHPVYAANEVNGSDRSFGFHATSGGILAGIGTDTTQVPVPVLGYFAGPAARITSTVHGKPVEAHLAKWSEDPGVVFFWFDPVQVPSAGALTPLAAYSSGGTRLTK